MKIKRRKKGIFQETAASSDLAFLLIIYFLVIAGFNINMGFIINLPAKNSTRLVQREELLRFEMDRNGAIIYRGEEIDIDEAEQQIRDAVRGHPELALVLSIDGEAPWQQVLYFVELAQKLEIEAFSFNLRDNGKRENS
jgi:biopolymer transport protein ExbD